MRFFPQGSLVTASFKWFRYHRYEFIWGLVNNGSDNIDMFNPQSSKTLIQMTFTKYKTHSDDF